MQAAVPPTDLTVETLPYPLAPAAQAELISLFRTEWSCTDYNWIEAMSGDYSAALVITSLLVRAGGIPVATATIHFPRHRPEVAVLGSVLTHPRHRRLGLAGRAIDPALTLAAEAGCRVCLLGTTLGPRNIYHRHGFVWHNGAVMRRTFGAGALEPTCFTAGQPAAIRPANWGDLPGVTLLLVQPVAMACLDFLRGLMSGRYSPAERCLSAFPLLWYETAAREGMLSVVAGADTGRIFGFGSVTRAPGPARRHEATLDFAAHENYEQHLPPLLDHLLEGCAKGGVRQVHACIAAGDTRKLAGLQDRGFREIARRSAALRLGGTFRDVVLLVKSL